MGEGKTSPFFIMFKKITPEDYINYLKDHKLIGMRMMCVKERKRSFIDCVFYGWIAKPDCSHIQFKKSEEFDAKCREEFSDSEFTILSHDYNPYYEWRREPFVWTGDYKDFDKFWELD